MTVTPVELSKAALPAAPLPGWRRRAEAFNAARAPAARKARRASATRTAPHVPKPENRIGLPFRAILALIGMFLGVLELSQLRAVIMGLVTGRLRTSNYRTGSNSYYWAEQPWMFSVNVTFGVLEVLAVGVIAWGCLRTAARGYLKQVPTVGRYGE